MLVQFLSLFYFVSLEDLELIVEKQNNSTNLDQHGNICQHLGKH